jgi:1-acyl-sn-glycerol-3-phosphate acyltransferase
LLYGAGYEVSGMENIPDDTPALIVYYHGAIPIDMYYFISKIVLCKDRLIHTVGDRFLFKLPGKYKEYNVMNVIQCIWKVDVPL